MATTTNFGWETPDDTDLVKDGAAAIRTALGGVDTSFVDLKGGTSGQVLSKATNTDLDFSWVTSTSGGMTSIASGSLSGSSVVLSTINQTYKDLRLIIRGMTMNTSDSYLTLKANAISTGYNAAWALSYQDTGYVGGNSNESVWRIAADAAQLRTNDQNFYVYDFFDYTSTADTKLASGYWHIYSGDLRVYTAALSVIGVDAAISTLTISNNAGNTFSGGTYELFGVK